MKRSFQHVYAAKSDVQDTTSSTMETEAVASHDADFVSRPRKHRVLCRSTPSTLEVISTPKNELPTYRSIAVALLSPPLSLQRRCGDLEAGLREEALLFSVLSFLNIREHQLIRQVNRSWRRRVQTLALNRLDLSAWSSPVTARTLNRACQGVLQSYSSVRRIDLSGQRSLGDRDLLVLTSCFWANLEEIVADDCLEISDFGLLAVLNAQSLRLRSVSVRRCKRVTGELFTVPSRQLTGSHTSLTTLNLDDTNVTRAFLSRLEAHFPTLQCLSAFHTPAHRTFFQQTPVLNTLLRELQLLVSSELVDLPLLPALLDEFSMWCRSRRGSERGAFERTLVSSGSRAVLDVPLLLTGNSDGGDIDFSEEEAGLPLMSPLLYACASGRTRVIPAILAAAQEYPSSCAFDLETTDADGHSPLSLAVANGLTEATRLLIVAGGDVNTRSRSLASPLYLASEHGWDILVDMLLDANARRDVAVNGGATALCAAAKNGHRSTVLRLLAAEKQAEDHGEIQSHRSKQQLVQALFLACEGGHLFVVSDLLLLTELDANVLMDENVSPLYLACQMGHVAIASLLLARGADPSFRRPEGGVSCLYIASQEGHDNLVRLLVHGGADVHAKMDDMSTALHIAARMGRKAVSRALLCCGARLNDQTRSGLSALYIASEEGHLRLVQFLLNADAALDTQTTSGATALFAAVHRGHSAVVKALLIGRASVAVAKHNGTSPLDAAVLLGDMKVVRLLLRFGARVGGLALHFAERLRDSTELQTLLRTHYYTQHFLNGVTTVMASIPPIEALSVATTVAPSPTK